MSRRLRSASRRGSGWCSVLGRIERWQRQVIRQAKDRRGRIQLILQRLEWFERKGAVGLAGGRCRSGRHVEPIIAQRF